MTFFERVPPPDDRRRPFDVVLLQESDADPLWDWEGRNALLITGKGVLVLFRRPGYSYARPATLEDLSAALGPTGGGLFRGREGILPTLVTRLPWTLIAQACAFFREVWNTYRTEDVLVVHFWPQEQRYALEHPDLHYAGDRAVGYEYPATPLGAITFGTIHGHPETSAFHSGTDRRDAVQHPGFHLVLGNVEKRVPSIACTFSDGTKFFQVDPADLLEELPTIGFPSQWLQRPANLPHEPPRSRLSSERSES